jgi:hypothetical protein
MSETSDLLLFFIPLLIKQSSPLAINLDFELKLKMPKQEDKELNKARRQLKYYQTKLARIKDETKKTQEVGSLLDKKTAKFQTRLNYLLGRDSWKNHPLLHKALGPLVKLRCFEALQVRKSPVRFCLSAYNQVETTRRETERISVRIPSWPSSLHPVRSCQSLAPEGH